VETWVDPGGGVTPHLHPAMEERFEMLEGRLSFLAGRKWSSAGPGETVVVPAGVRHAYRNKGNETAPHGVPCPATPDVAGVPRGCRGARPGGQAHQRRGHCAGHFAEIEA
jgi:quercetin dioxygenase-like cupin family protein